MGVEAQSASCPGTMKTVVVLAALVALSLAANLPPVQRREVETRPVDADFVARQRRVLTFFRHVEQFDHEEEWYKAGREYDLQANINNYTNKQAVEQFLVLYRAGFLPKFEVFSIFDERMREEAIALFRVFYYAKDFETFYRTACWARVHLNEYQFIYTFYIAILQRPDCRGIVVPAPYEVYPEFFTNSEAMFKAYRVQMQNGLLDENLASHHGIVRENNNYVFLANYSTYWTYGPREQRLAYFTEDVGLNSYYYYFHSYFPFWMEGQEEHNVFRERRGEAWYYFYQQLLARYYLERLCNGLGEIPEFSWNRPIRTSYTPFMSTLYYPFVQRNGEYLIPVERYNEEIQFLNAYEQTFLQYLQRGQFRAYNQEIDFHNSKAINFVGNYWQSNADLYEKTGPRNFFRSYEIIARHLLSAVPESFERHAVLPAALNFYQTSLRDPMFYQLYGRILRYFLQYKEYLQPYNQDRLHYVGVKINDVHVDRLVTFFDFFEYDITNGIYRSNEEIKSGNERYLVRQPRLNHKPFSVTVDVKSDVESEAVIKIFLGPRYDSNGFPISLEDNYMNFVELDWFRHKLTTGQNKIVRNSEDFYFYKDDSVPITDIYRYLEQGKVPRDMSEDFDSVPSRLMLPRGTEGGFPYQLFVFVYPYQAPETNARNVLVDNSPFGYPFDRPVDEAHFRQPNMFFEDVFVYFEGTHFPYQMNNPSYVPRNNEVPRH